MADRFTYPFDGDYLLKKKKSLRKELLQSSELIEKKIAILGGSTTDLFKHMLELFLLKNGIKPNFYETEYNKYYEELLFDDKELKDFAPDLFIIHTNARNLKYLPPMISQEKEFQESIENEIESYHSMWNKIDSEFKVPIIQNNFDFHPDSVLANFEESFEFSHTHYVKHINSRFSKESKTRASLNIFDISKLSAEIGLQNWHDPSAYFSYKYMIKIDLIPLYSYQLSQYCLSLFGKSKKCLVLDLDNTLWGGVIGDDGLNGIVLGQDNPRGQAHMSLQSYAKKLKERGVILAVCSKNDEKNAREGFEHPDMLLKLDDISCFKANWEPKHINIQNIASELNIGLDSFVFLDDNPAERSLVRNQLPMVSVPEIGKNVEDYTKILNFGRFFELSSLSKEDAKRTKMYEDNAKRKKVEQSFSSYDDFLKSLEMVAEIETFTDKYLERITQLINKTNQFNLNTKRMDLSEVKDIQENNMRLGLYARLKDKFGDNGLISVVTVELSKKEASISNWLMSCRVLKRNMEFAMMDGLIEKLKERKVEILRGYYIPTAKNQMVADHYLKLGFTQCQDQEGSKKTFELKIADYKSEPRFINLDKYE